MWIQILPACYESGCLIEEELLAKVRWTKQWRRNDGFIVQPHYYLQTYLRTEIHGYWNDRLYRKQSGDDSTIAYQQRDAWRFILSDFHEFIRHPERLALELLLKRHEIETSKEMTRRRPQHIARYINRWSTHWWCRRHSTRDATVTI